MELTPHQAAYVAKVFPEAKEKMADFLARGVAVGIRPQDECGPDTPRFAIWVIEDPAFWIDCCPTVEEAKALAKSLGLSIAKIVD